MSAEPKGPSNGNKVIQRTRKKMGYKNNWSRFQVDESQQQVWQHPMPSNPRIAVIGGGLSGLSCARELALQGISSVVFDTGKNSVGGRLATRTNQDKSIPARPRSLQSDLKFDHAAQFFTVSDPRFRALVDSWLSDGVVKPWEGPVGMLASDGSFTSLRQLDPAAPTPYVATHGMRMLAKHMEQQLLHEHGDLVETRRPCWVSQVVASPGGWKLTGERQDQGVFDGVVVAHNGKCANRLIGPIGAPLVAKQLMGLRLSAIWAVMVAFKEPVAAPFEGAFVQGNSMLSWVGNNSKKLGLDEAPECWTFLSHNTYGQQNKVPQEAIPPEVSQKVLDDALGAFAHALKLPGPDSLPPVVFYRCQLWGAALPLNSPGVECIWDPASRVGVAGDWVAGSSMEAASVSGVALAQRIIRMRGVQPSQGEDSLAIGLRDGFRPLASDSASHEIGGFPGLKLSEAGSSKDQQQSSRPPQQRSAGGGRGRGRGRGPPGQQQGSGPRSTRPAPPKLPVAQ